MPAGHAILRDRAGTAAVEFAFILPVMLALWAGTVEMAHAIDNWRKVTSLARAVADLTSQGDAQNPIATATMTDILASSAAVLRPFASSGARIVVSALEVPLATTVTPTVCSSYASSNATARTRGLATDLTVPGGFHITGERYVLAEVTMPYTPIFGGALVSLVNGLGTITLKAAIAWPTRGGQTYASTYNEVVLPSGTQCP